MYELSEEIPMDKNIKHNIDIVVDRLVVKPGIEKRLTCLLYTSPAVSIISCVVVLDVREIRVNPSSLFLWKMI